MTASDRSGPELYEGFRETSTHCSTNPGLRSTTA